MEPRANQTAKNFSLHRDLNQSLILASASPRRLELLRSVGVMVEVIPAGVEEKYFPGELPEEHVERLAHEKARVVAKNHTNRWVLGADTVVVLPPSTSHPELIHRECSQILGKPESVEDAKTMLRRLSGKVHQVITGVCLMRMSASQRAEIQIWHSLSEVTFRSLSEEEIESYVASGEPMDKAGAYAIQGGAARFVTGWTGLWSTIVGLPIEEVCQCLSDIGYFEGFHKE